MKRNLDYLIALKIPCRWATMCLSSLTLGCGCALVLFIEQIVNRDPIGIIGFGLITAIIGTTLSRFISLLSSAPTSPVIPEDDERNHYDNKPRNTRKPVKKAIEDSSSSRPNNKTEPHNKRNDIRHAFSKSGIHLAPSNSNSNSKLTNSTKSKAQGKQENIERNRDNA